MSTSTPWKLGVTGGVGIVAGVALLSVDWTVAPLAAFVGLALVARGALHLVTPVSFVGFAGAFAVLEVAGDAGIGITALAWPEPTLLSVALLAGSWAVSRALVGILSAATPCFVRAVGAETTNGKTANVATSLSTPLALFDEPAPEPVDSKEGHRPSGRRRNPVLD